MDRNHADETDAAETDGIESTTASRRRVLQTTAGTAVGGAGLAGATGSASGIDGCDDWPNAPAEYPEIDLASGNPTATNVDDIADGETDEVVVFVHGWAARPARIRLTPSTTGAPRGIRRRPAACSATHWAVGSASRRSRRWATGRPSTPNRERSVRGSATDRRTATQTPNRFVPRIAKNPTRAVAALFCEPDSRFVRV